MGVLQEFERRLEGAVEGTFARMFRSGLQPIELAKGLQRYARDTQHVSHDGVVVPNVFRFVVHAKDLERLGRVGDLRAELAGVIVGTAREKGWILRGPAAVLLEAGEVSVGRYELSGRVEVVDPSGPVPVPAPEPAAPAPASAAPAAPAPPVPAAASADATQMFDPNAGRQPTVVITGEGEPVEVALHGRTVAGRAPGCGVLLSDTTVSREHAAFVRREDGWWVMDLGSMNGTKVNGRVAAEHPLRPGDRVELGDALLEFVER